MRTSIGKTQSMSTRSRDFSIHLTSLMLDNYYSKKTTHRDPNPHMHQVAPLVKDPAKQLAAQSGSLFPHPLYFLQ